MIVQRNSLARAISFAVLGVAQTGAPAAAPASTVYTNPRASSDDPRIGLKGGLYDAGEAAFGMQRIVSLPNPPGFGPGNDATATMAAAPPIAAPAAEGEQQLRPTGGSYGSTNSDLAFSGNRLFVGNYNGVN